MLEHCCAVIDPNGAACNTDTSFTKLLRLQLRLLAACDVRSFFLYAPPQALECLLPCFTDLVSSDRCCAIFLSPDAESAIAQAEHVLILNDVPGNTALRHARMLRRRVIFLNLPWVPPVERALFLS